MMSKTTGGFTPISDLQIQLAARRLRNLENLPWESTSLLSPEIEETYPWSTAVAARFKFGLLEWEKRLAREAKRSKRSKSKRDSDEDGEDELPDYCEVGEVKRLTHMEFQQVPRDRFLTKSEMRSLIPRELTELAHVSAEDRKTMVMSTPSIPRQRSFTNVATSNPSRKIQTLGSTSRSLQQIARTIAFSANEILFGLHTEGEVSPIRANRISDALLSTLDAVNNLTRIVNISALREANAAPELMQSLSGRSSAGLGNAMNSVNELIHDRAMKYAKNFKRGPPTQNGPRGGAYKTPRNRPQDNGNKRPKITKNQRNYQNDNRNRNRNRNNQNQEDSETDAPHPKNRQPKSPKKNNKQGAYRQ